MLKRVFAALLSLSSAAVVGAGTTVTVKGSDTMVILNQRWAEAYMRTRPSDIIQVTGGGSGTGIAALAIGSTDICAASRAMKEKEKASIKSKSGTDPVEIPVAKDGVAVYLNEANPVKELSLDQVRDIYMGKVTNWKQVGGNDERIILYSRENNSGTYVFFKEHVLGGKDFSPLAQSLPGTAAVANALAKDKRGIGYGGAAYAKGIKFCAVKATPDAPAYLPTEDNILSGKYAASRDLYFDVRTTPQGAVKTFIDWVLSAEGQSIVSQVGYFPLKKK
jgi:phosphate transport system substrate-binding protein